MRRQFITEPSQLRTETNYPEIHIEAFIPDYSRNTGSGNFYTIQNSPLNTYKKRNRKTFFTSVEKLDQIPKKIAKRANFGFHLDTKNYT